MAQFQHIEELTPSPAVLFAWFQRPVQAIQAVAAARLELLDGPEVLTPGAVLTLRTRRHGLSQKILQRVDVVDAPHRLVIVQTRGPLKAYRLEQSFEAIEGGTRLTEVIDFEPPGGVLGLLLTEAVVRDEFAQLYHLRRQVFQDLDWLLGLKENGGG